MEPMGRSSNRSGQSRNTGRGAATGRSTRPGTGRSPASNRRRTGHAKRASGGREAARVSWSRRIGIIGALLLAGASVVFAGQALQSPEQTAGPGSSPINQPGGATAGQTSAPTLAQAPTLDQPAPALVTAGEIDVSGRLNEELPRDGSYRLRIYVNGELVRDRRLPRRQAFNIPAVPLTEGHNEITASVAGAVGESLHSGPIEVELDTTPPLINVLEPLAGEIYASETVVRGTSEAGATLSVSNRTNRAGATLVVPPDGTFEVGLALAAGHNEIVLEARDRAGNTDTTSFSLERREGQASVRLSLSRPTIALESLPAAITIRARVLDAAGGPVDGAEVTLSLSPPGLPTVTHVATSQAGSVIWTGVRIARDGAQPGQGLATVLAVLPDGTTLQASEFFTVE
jgi:hypothetical protein